MGHPQPMVKKRPRGRGSRGRSTLGRLREEGRYTKPGPKLHQFPFSSFGFVLVWRTPNVEGMMPQRS
jgi:hypothetical protein